MKWLRNYKLFKESKQEYSNKNLIHEICVSMILLNNEFLDNILDKGMKARYSEDSNVFLTDLKNLILAKNRLHLGKFTEENKCVSDDEVSKINALFDSVDFSIEDDWDRLISARITARSIIDKLIPDEKLNSERVTAVYWIGPNKDKDHQEDIVLETADGRQYSFFLNKNLNTQKSASFNLFADDLIGENLDKMFKEEYLSKWDKLTQEWIRIIYENSNKNIQQHIEKFIDPNRIEVIGYFEYYDIRHKDPRFKHLGEFIKEFDKNILKFSDLMSEIWKNRDICFMDIERVYKEWMETKVFILNSKILEHLLTNSLKSSNEDDIIKQNDEFKLANGTVKMKLFKTLVEKIGCFERPIYFLGNNGNYFYQVPSRDFFRKFYDEINIKFDYHVKFIVSKEEENNDFNIKIILEMDNKPLINMNISVKFSGGEMSGKLSAKYKFNLSDDFNYTISKKQLDPIQED
jgi:hypothetical protein